MKLIVGLGNPGEKFQKTRHNAGFLVLDELILKIANNQFPISNWVQSKKFNAEIAKNEKIILAKPQTFMNDSGSAVSAITSYFKITSSQVYIVHDDLDIKLGDYKIQKGVGPKVHNGINSIEEKLGTKDFWRVRIGIENRSMESKELGDIYVLQNFTSEEKIILDKVIGKVLVDLTDIFSKQ